MTEPAEAPGSDPTEPTEVDLHWMDEAIAQAHVAGSHRDVPVGAVVVLPGQTETEVGTLLGVGHNRREADADPTAHAEVLALRDACQKRGHWRLDDATLYVTLEPCAMCAGALVNARIGRLVYGATDPKAGAIESLFSLAADTRLNHRFETVGGVRAEPCRHLLQAFFRQLRAEGQK